MALCLTYLKGIVLDISIVFATYHNEEILKKTLESYCLISTQYQWELIIVDNANREETRQIVNAYKTKLPIQFIEQSEPGKNNALNKALPLINGDLVMFTDNDILPNSDLINIYVDSARAYPEIKIFSGRIIPDIEIPEWIDTSSHRIRSALGIYDKGETNKEILPVDVWGGNMLLKKEVFTKGISFNSNVGPNGINYVMGSETELLKRLQAGDFKAMYIAKSKVFHQIRSEQLSINWLTQRSYRSGKGSAFNNENNAISLFGVPRYLLKKLVIDYFCFVKALMFGDKRLRCLTSMEYNFTKGKTQQIKQQNK